ncbi:hypothetical protein DFH08DRAFT_812939 [Mycena albidolilacea]|uniref:Uncharacterized protein n=1 Tax=Mycena albidolilacea TaxID=1033008 RepID=A0AAD6ZTB7_9AGAR|nr:hypothetical protein DFH08DRAFT_812939 [Mycena albidolilacea]
MDCAASRCFTAPNVSGPSSRFFIPHGGLADFLLNNIRLKVFLLIPQTFTDAYVADTVQFLMTPQREELRCHVRELVRHVMFAAKIQQNELCVLYTMPTIPSEAAWMFHVMQVIVIVIGFDTEANCPSKANRSPISVELKGAAVHLQAMFFLNGVLSMFCEKMKAGEAVFLDYPEYDPSHWVSNNFAYCSLPTSFLPIPVDDSLADSFEYNEAIMQWRVGWRHRSLGSASSAMTMALQRIRTRSVRVSQISREGMPSAIDVNFFVKEEERARSKSSHSSLRELVTPPPLSEY